MLTSSTNQRGREFGCLQQPHPSALSVPFLSSQRVVVTESFYPGRFTVAFAPLKEFGQPERGILDLASHILLVR